MRKFVSIAKVRTRERIHSFAHQPGIGVVLTARLLGIQDQDLHKYTDNILGLIITTGGVVI
jgi:hypothetical protein